MIGPITAGYIDGAEAAAYEAAWQAAPAEVDPSTFPEPEDRGTAVLSGLGHVEYVDDLIRPGRIVVWAAEEGSGKSYTVDGELGIRVAVAGGSLAETWMVLRTGPVLYLSEMHGDDDHDRETAVLGSLGVERAALTGRYYRLPLMTAANGAPALTVAPWRAWITSWLREHGALLLIVDTATGATQVDPWGAGIQAVYTGLRQMLAEYPELAIVLVVHVRKPTGRGDRRISDVLGEWGRWCDVVVMQENDGASLERAKITVRKRVRRERRIIATKAGGLLVDPKDTTAGATKIPADDVHAAVALHPGVTYAELGAILDVSKDTASNYVKAAKDRYHLVPSGPKGTIRVYTTAEPPNSAERAQIGGDSAVVLPSPPSAERTYIRSAVGSAVGTPPGGRAMRAAGAVPVDAADPVAPCEPEAGL